MSRIHTPRSVQFLRPRGAPLYPVETMLSFFTMIAPYFFLRQVLRSATVSAISR